MNILVTGASRGIGAAAYALLKSTAIASSAIPRSGSDELIAGDLADPAAPRAIWDTRARRARRPDRRAGQQCRHLRGGRRQCADDEWHAGLGPDDDASTSSRAADLCRLAVSHFLDRGGGGRIVNVASRAAYRGDSPQHWHYAASKGGMVGDDQDDRARLCRRGHPRLRGRAGLHRVRHGRGISRRAAAARRSSPTSRSAASRSTDEVAEVIRWLAIDAPPRRPAASIDVNGASYVR